MTVDQVVRQALGVSHRGRRPVVLPPTFQGLPGMAHGGTVLALFDAAAGDDGPRRVAAHYRKRVPLATPLVLDVAEGGGAVTCRVLDPGGAVLVDGRVTRSSPVAEGDARRPSSTAASPAPWPLPVSAQCFVCGVTNELGLQATLGFDDRVVHGTWAARLPFRRDDDSLAPAALLALLDEAAFWLGVLATGESGMTTELAMTLHAPVAAGSTLTVVGDRASVTPREDPRHLDTAVVALDAAGVSVATARITFVAVRGAARRIAEGMLAMNGADCLRRVFPAYVH